MTFPEDTDDPEKACREYEKKSRRNGHLGFNEPPSGDAAPTRAVLLTVASLVSNAVYWGGLDRVPRKGITAGMDRLLRSRHILLLVSSSHKREILRKTLLGPVTDKVPSSHLQFRSNVTVIVDETAWPADGNKTTGGTR